MKAKEYFEKYKDLGSEPFEARKPIAKKLFLELSDEVTEICNSRKIRTNVSLISVIKEINQKWNAIANLFEKEYGEQILARNGFKEQWKDLMPELKDYL